MAAQNHSTILIVDFGSQWTQLIARRVREANVFCEIVPFQAAEAAFERLKPKGVILSGGPSSVAERETPRAPAILFSSGVPVLGICYGQMAMAAQLGGEVESGHHREFGRAEVDIVSPSALFEGVWRKGERHTVWMSHGDRVTKLPPGFSQAAVSRELALCGAHRREAALFRPDVPPRGGAYAATARSSSRISCTRSQAAPGIGPWRPIARRRSRKIRAQVGDGRVHLRPLGRGQFGGRRGAHP